jgi:hypothetical protein
MTDERLGRWRFREPPHGRDLVAVLVAAGVSFCQVARHWRHLAHSRGIVTRSLTLVITEKLSVHLVPNDSRGCDWSITP